MAASACYAEYKLLSYLDLWFQVGNIHAPSNFSQDRAINLLRLNFEIQAKQIEQSRVILNFTSFSHC